MNLNIGYGVKTIIYLELNSRPTNCQYLEMGSHFEYGNPKFNAPCTAMRTGTSLMTRHFKINTFVFSEHNSLLKVNPISGHDTSKYTYTLN
jgi:hypothetical protein